MLDSVGDRLFQGQFDAEGYVRAVTLTIDFIHNAVFRHTGIAQVAWYDHLGQIRVPPTPKSEGTFIFNLPDCDRERKAWNIQAWPKPERAWSAVS